MHLQVSQAKALRGEVTIPGDKSVTHRAYLLNALARGTATIQGASQGEDCRSTLACLAALGTEITEKDGAVVIKGRGLNSFSETKDTLNAGNSGTTLRLLTGVLAGSGSMFSVLTGDSSLRSRPMDRVVKPLRTMGAQIWGREDGRYAPLAVRGTRLKGATHRLPMASAQVKSALLLAGLHAEGETAVEEPAATRDHTERMLKAMGIRIHHQGNRASVQPGELTAVDLRVPGDISSAAFWLVAGVIHPRASIVAKNVGINPTRTGIIEVLRSMGAWVRIVNQRDEGGEPVADLEVESSSLQATEVAGDLVPRAIDELPLVALAACFAQGTTVIKDAEELRVKESDRIKSTVTELNRLGGHADELPDGMVIHGTGGLRGAACQSHGDHRIAMMLAIAGLVAQGETTVQQAEVVEISYPTFWQDLKDVSGG
jgi:3-phosphoshikimate 1-carboxyvinyltransferase